MIGKICGIVDHRAEDHVLVDVNGIGYLVYCSQATLSSLPSAGEEIELYTELLVREDLLQLFGFLTPMERELYRSLLTVQGVGAKAAQSIVGTLGVTAGIRAISLGDWNALKAARYVGQKIAQRIVHELQGKIAAMISAHGEFGSQPGPGAAGVSTASDPSRSVAGGSEAMQRSEALSALVNLGYQQSEAARAVATVATEMPEPSTEAIIRESLKRLAVT